jgi:methyl-accepting chemotaxis protein
LVYQISRQIISINEAYKDTTRTRSAMTRAYTTLKEDGRPEDRLSALANAERSHKRTLATLSEFERADTYDGEDKALKSSLVEAGHDLAGALEKSAQALNGEDAHAYSTINATEITPKGAAFSARLEKFQEHADVLITDIMADGNASYRWIMIAVGAGLAIALALVVAAHMLLKRIVLHPLRRAVSLLDQVAQGDLTARIETGGSNEIGQLIGAVGRMQRGLHSTVANVRDGAQVIHGGAQEIAAGNMDLSSRTESQASPLEETAASMEELTGTVKQNSASAQQAKVLADAASGVAAKGGEVMREVMTTMDGINDAARKIVDITSVIDGIAFQTNILALNAAVEAARAGEHGRGFAVVSSEVRTLAQRSALAAKEIKVLIDSSVKKIDSGAILVGHAGTTMTDLVNRVGSVADMISDIARAGVEQSAGIEQVNQAIAQMDAVTQQNAALVEQAAAAAASLRSQAQTLTESVSIFKIGDTAMLTGAVALANRRWPIR